MNDRAFVTSTVLPRVLDQARRRAPRSRRPRGTAAPTLLVTLLLVLWGLNAACLARDIFTSQSAATESPTTGSAATESPTTGSATTESPTTGSATTGSAAESLPITFQLALTDEGRELLGYVARCALAPGQTLGFSVDGTAYSYEGSLGLVPEWTERVMTPVEERWLTACLLAHVNGLGEHVLISVRAEGVVEADEEEQASYAVYEGAFFGSFAEAELFACSGTERAEALALSPDRGRRICTDADEACGLDAVGSCSEVCGSWSDVYGWTDCQAGGEVHAQVVNVFLRGGHGE
jgi:hypothetical protein